MVSYFRKISVDDLLWCLIVSALAVFGVSFAAMIAGCIAGIERLCVAGMYVMLGLIIAIVLILIASVVWGIMLGIAAIISEIDWSRILNIRMNEQHQTLCPICNRHKVELSEFTSNRPNTSVRVTYNIWRCGHCKSYGRRYDDKTITIIRAASRK